MSNNPTTAGNILQRAVDRADPGAVTGATTSNQTVLDRLASSAARLNNEAYDGNNLVAAARDVAGAYVESAIEAGLITGGTK